MVKRHESKKPADDSPEVEAPKPRARRKGTEEGKAAEASRQPKTAAPSRRAAARPRPPGESAEGSAPGTDHAGEPLTARGPVLDGRMHRPAGARERVGGAEGPTAEEDAAKTGHLAGQFLIAMPSMGDPRFARSLVYICLHSEEGALGIIVNRALEGLSFEELLRQLNIEPVPPGRSIRMHRGGPVEAGRGFVLHSADWVQDSSLRVSRGVALTASVEILKEIAQGRGPERGILALGYAGWGPGQLDREIQENAWLSAPADAALLFDGGLETKWQRALAKIGVDPALLSGAAGHA